MRDLEENVAFLEKTCTTLMKARDELHARLLRYQEMESEWEYFFNYSLDMLCVVGPAGQPVKINRAFELALGYSCEEFVSLPFEVFCHPDDVKRAQVSIENHHKGMDILNFEVRMRHKNGEYRWLTCTSPGKNDISKNLYIIARDITDSKLTESELLYRAQHDALTGLGNRALFDSALEQVTARAARHPGYSVGLLFIDLDGFKAVNDLHGHGAGDEVLKVIAQRLSARQRRNDIVCRLGGDEFAWLAEGPSPLSLDALAQNIIAEVSRPISIGTVNVNVGCSIGISLLPDMAEDPTNLVRQADDAMYLVKQHGKNAYQYFIKR